MPRPDDPCVEAWASLLHAHARVVARIERDLATAVDLPLPSYDVLLELGGAPRGRLRLQDLASRVTLSRSRVSRVVDQMVRDGLVAKEPDPSDARATFARITPHGRRVQRRAAPTYLRAIGEHFAAYLTDEQCVAVHDALGAFRSAPDR